MNLNFIQNEMKANRDEHPRSDMSPVGRRIHREPTFIDSLNLKLRFILSRTIEFQMKILFSSRVQMYRRRRSSVRDCLTAPPSRQTLFRPATTADS